MVQQCAKSGVARGKIARGKKPSTWHWSTHKLLSSMESSSTCLKETGRRVRASDNYSPVCDTDTVASCHWQPLDPISEADPLSTSVEEARYILVSASV